MHDKITKLKELSPEKKTVNFFQLSHDAAVLILKIRKYGGRQVCATCRAIVVASALLQIEFKGCVYVLLGESVGAYI